MRSLSETIMRLAGKAGLEKEFQRTFVRGYRDVSSNRDLTGNGNEFIIKSDIQLIPSLGAKSIYGDIRVLDLQTNEDYPLANRTGITQVVVFAGKGTGHEYRMAWKFAERYGGDVDDWQHIKGRAVLETEDGNRPAAIHWSECEGIGAFEFFVKKWLDE